MQQIRLIFWTYLRFSAENSFSRNLKNCSLPAASFSNSFNENAHLRTRRHGTSLLLVVKQSVNIMAIYHAIMLTFVVPFPRNQWNHISMDLLASDNDTGEWAAINGEQHRTYPFAGLERRHKRVIFIPLVVEGGVGFGNFANLDAPNAMVQSDSKHITLSFEYLRLVGLIHWTDSATAHRTCQMLIELKISTLIIVG